MQETETLARRWRPHPDALLDNGPDGTVMLTPDGQMFRLNPVAEFIWTRLDGQRSVGEILEALLVEFAVPSRQAAEADMLGFLNALEQGKLIEAV